MNNKRVMKLKEAGITLVALVVTIIVLLILAGITISLVLGQNGLIQRAQGASNTMAKATANEITQMGQYANDIDELTSGFISGGSEQGGSGSGSGTGTGGSITIKDKDNNDLAISEVASKYGHDVVYNGNTYQLFYVDTTGKYSGGTPGTWLQLKATAGDYTPNTASNTTLITTENSILWNLNPDMKQYYDTLKDKTTQDSNMLAVSGLCDPANWNTRGGTTYVPTTDQGKGAFAIGGVSAEMFCDSYNQARASTATQFSAKAFNQNSTYGYFYKPKNSKATGNYANGDYGGWTDNSGNQITTSTASGMYRISNTSTWLASPIASSTDGVCRVRGDLRLLGQRRQVD